MSERRYLDERAGSHPFDYDAPENRPNIVFISVDMIPRESYALDSPVRQHLNTPNLDRLMNDGVRFENAFCASPLCVPSRACYLTRRYPYLTVNEERAHDGRATALRADDTIFPEYLRETGYNTKHTGKCHVGTTKFMDAFGENDSPWDRWAPPMDDDDDYLRYLREMGATPPVWPDPLQGLRPDRKTPGNSYGGWVQQADGSELPEEATYSQYLAWRASQQIQSAQMQEGPLYLQVDFFAPHQPFFVPGAYRERARQLNEHIELPESYYDAIGDGIEGLPRVYDFYMRNWGLYRESTAETYMLLNFLQIEALDTAIGRVLDALDEAGMYDDSMIIFIGDHGEMNCHRALVDKGVYGHPRVSRVPLAVKPAGEKPGDVVDSFVSLLDLAPTIFDVTGVNVPDRLDGESLLPFISGEKIQRDEPFIFEAGWHTAPNPAVATFAELDSGQFMYTYNLTSDYDELYDLQDPQYPNLAQDAVYAQEKAEMIRRLGAFLEGDQRWTCYWHTFRLDRWEHFDLGSGDMQMFKPQ
ncbi:MAG: sulfatase-like hydrolase/transferase [Armatimonadota bacterium]